MTGCYLTSLPFEFMRAVADFDPDWSGSYYVPRSHVEPSAYLLSKVWPQLDEWRRAFEAPDDTTIPVQQNKAAGAFLELLAWLREVVLQDAAVIISLFPSHPLFQDPVFSTPEFGMFRHQVLAACQTAHKDTHITAIERALPAVAEKLRTIASQQTHDALASAQREGRLIEKLEVLEKKFEDFQQMSFTFTISPGGTRGQQRVEISEEGNRYSISDRGPFQQIPRSVAVNAGPATPPLLDVPSQSVPPLPPKRPDEKPPEWTLPRDLKTVVDLLVAWEHGWGFMPAVKVLDERWQHRWRPLKERQFYSSRRMIVDEIYRRSRVSLDALTPREVARLMDEERGRGSLDSVFKGIKRRKTEQNAAPQ